MRHRSKLVILLVATVLTLPFWAQAQVDCPAMGITRPKSSTKRMLSGFESRSSGGGRSGQMADFFVTKDRSPGRTKEHTEFATRGGRAGFFRDFDEFANSRKGHSGSFRDMDEFSRKGSGRQQRYRDFDEFSRKANRQAASNNRSGSGKTPRGFHRRAQRVKSQDGREERGRNNRGDYTAFATRGRDNEPTFREPQMGLWGGTIGKRGGKEKRKMVPMPDEGKKEDE